MLGGLAYMTPLQVSNPANGRSLILYKRDVVSGPGALSTITATTSGSSSPAPRNNSSGCPQQRWCASDGTGQ